MASKKITLNYDLVDLDRVLKKLVVTAIQIIVQSRLGGRIRTYCKPFMYSNDYFNIAVNDIPDVRLESERVLDSGSVTKRLPLSIEISLKTVEGKSLVLENWILGLYPTAYNANAKVNNDLHNKLSLMLKSILSITRVLPAYKISRNQEPDAYTVYYRLQMGSYDYKALGEGFKKHEISKVACCQGSLFMSVLYRTNMIITPDSQLVKCMETKTKNIDIPKRTVDFSKPMKMGAFVDITGIKEFKDEALAMPEEPKNSWLLELAEEKYGCIYMNVKEQDDNTELDVEDEDEDEEEEEGEGEATAIAVQKDVEDESVTQKERKRVWDIDEEDPKFMTALNCPFATASPLGELAIFYREFYHAPSLQTFDEFDLEKNTPEDECASCVDPQNAISEQLKGFEDSLQNFDKMVTDFCQFSGEYL